MSEQPDTYGTSDGTAVCLYCLRPWAGHTPEECRLPWPDDEVRQALEFYADPARWRCPFFRQRAEFCTDPGHIEAVKDSGQRARRALGRGE